MDWIAIIAGFLSGVIGSMGLGGGGVLMIYLTAIMSVEQLRAQGINLLFFLPCGLVAVIIYAYKKEIHLKKIIVPVVLGICGVYFGVQIANIIGTELLSKLFACFLILLGLKTVFAKYE